MKKIVLVVLLIAGCLNLSSQNYHAVQGSSYAGVLGVANNPSSIVNVPFPWDVNIFSLQYKNATNAVEVLKYSLLSSPINSEYRIVNGNFSRFGKGNFNVHLLNARIALNRRHAVAFGVNLRGYAQVKTGKYHFVDTLKNLSDFLKINLMNPVQSGSTTGNGWLELSGTYAGTVWDRESGRLNAGISLKLNRGLSGVFAGLQNAVANPHLENGRPTYLTYSANLQYGYPASHDNWSNDRSTGTNIRELVRQSNQSISFDLGIEYIKKAETISNFGDEDNYYDYEWKLGAAVLDVGHNQFTYGNESRYIGNPRQNITAEDVEGAVKSVDGIRSFNDSLVNIATGIQVLSGTYNIINPARLVINIDKYLYNSFYINGEASFNLAALAGQEKLAVSEINLVTVTPRWETRRFGVYFPMQYNTEGQFWVGGAFKAGPLLIGVHNWANVFAKNKIQNGGAYLAFVIRPGRLTGLKQGQGINCPEY